MSTSDRVLAAMAAYDLKQKGNTSEYRANSPFRPGSNSHAFSLTIDGPENGAYFDHVSDERGSLYDLAKRLSIPIPAVAPIETTKRKYTGRDDYARAHGITDWVLETWHWRETELKGRPVLEFPTQTGRRWRFLDGKKPHYISELNYQRCWYGLSPQMIEYLEKTHRLVICNGEVSSIAGQYAGMVAIAVTAGEKEIPSALIDELRGKVNHIETLEIIIATDCDDTGRKAARAMQRQLDEAGFNVRAVDLKLGNGGDLADFCMLHGEDAYKNIVELPALPAPIGGETERTWRFVTIEEVLKAPPIEWLIPRMIPSRGLTVIFGESGTYKSFFALHYGLMISHKQPVVYIASEGETGYRQRLEAWMKKHPERKVNDLTFVMGTLNMFDSDDLYEFAEIAAKYNPCMIVVDTLSMNIGEADTNSGRDMVVFFQACKRLSSNLNCSIVLIHHTNAEGRRATGSQRIKDSVDTMIRLSRVDDMIAVESKKTKDTSPFDTFYLKEVVMQLGYKNSMGEEVTSLVLQPSDMVIRDNDLTDIQADILDAIMIDPSQSFAEIADILETSRNSVSSAIRQLMRKGYIIRSAQGLEITPSGERTMQQGESSESSESSGLHNTIDDDSANSDDSHDSVTQSELFEVVSPQKERYYRN